MEFSKELIAKARACESEEELKALAEENGIEIADDELKLFLADNAEGELADDELEAVSGGRACNRNEYDVVFWNTKEEVEYLFDIGDVTQAFIGQIFGSETATVRITERRANFMSNHKWIDEYVYDRISGSPTNFGFGWQNRRRFQK